MKEEESDRSSSSRIRRGGFKFRRFLPEIPGNWNRINNHADKLSTIGWGTQYESTRLEALSGTSARIRTCFFSGLILVNSSR
jgi:hypothetical protein